MERYDAAIIGSGPAGLEAAINLSIRGKSFLLFGVGDVGGRTRTAPMVDNYLGIPGVTGAELAGRFQAHIQKMGIQARDERVGTVYRMGDYYAIAGSADAYEATCVIIATGAIPARFLPGEERLLGRGVGYCATCDAPLFRDRAVAVLGWNDESVREANFLSEVAREVYYIPMKRAGRALGERVTVVEGTAPEILGETRVEALRLRECVLEVDGVFVLRESVAPASLAPGLAVEDGYIRVDARMRTNLPGCFAAGDCTGKPHQFMRAAGQGQIAALSAAEYLDDRKS